MPLGIDENVVRVTTDSGTGQHGAIPRAQCDQFRRIAENAEYALLLMIDRHGKIRTASFIGNVFTTPD